MMTKYHWEFGVRGMSIVINSDGRFDNSEALEFTDIGLPSILLDWTACLTLRLYELSLVAVRMVVSSR